SAVLVERLRALDEKALAQTLDPSEFPVPVPQPTLGALLTVFMFHESYHAGQIGTLRRLIGKDPVLK
ncbi:MAG: hypothetical protein KJ645_06310, partial [Planctomycetes bacterium]|nr:hypothetical protein [Planctomycetota bacterium]